MTLRPLTRGDISQLGVNLAGGFVVTEIEEGSPADHAGFQRGLIVETIDGRLADSITAAAKLLAGKRAGETVRLTVLLPGTFQRASVDLKVR